MDKSTDDFVMIRFDSKFTKQIVMKPKKKIFLYTLNFGNSGRNMRNQTKERSQNSKINSYESDREFVGSVSSKQQTLNDIQPFR